jgi:hypothetical protein
MFELTKDEFENLRCQFGTSSWGGKPCFYHIHALKNPTENRPVNDFSLFSFHTC